MKTSKDTIMAYIQPKEKIVCVSGYFTLLHVGHLRMFKEAKKLGDRLVVIVNNDKQLMAKKGSIVVTADARAELIRGFECVDEVVVALDEDATVCYTLECIKPSIFANGGDRKIGNVPENDICMAKNIDMAFNVGGEKVDSSTRLLSTIEKAWDNPEDERWNEL